MTKFIVWIAHHPDVVVSFNKDSILGVLCVEMRIQYERLVIRHAIDDLECPWLVEDDEHLIEVLNNLYDKLNNEKEENDENDRY